MCSCYGFAKTPGTKCGHMWPIGRPLGLPWGPVRDVGGSLGSPGGSRTPPQNTPECKCTGIPCFGVPPMHLILVLFLGLPGSSGALGCSLAHPGGVQGVPWTLLGGPWGSCCRLNIDRNVDKNPLRFLLMFLQIFGRPGAHPGFPWGGLGAPGLSRRLSWAFSGAAWAPWASFWVVPGVLGRAWGNLTGCHESAMLSVLKATDLLRR